MKSATVKVSSKGQIVIPKEVRDDLHWGNGVELTLVMTEQGVMPHTKTQVEKQPNHQSIIFPVMPGIFVRIETNSWPLSKRV